MKKTLTLAICLATFFNINASEPNLDFLKQRLNDQAKIKSVKPSVIAGLYEVQVNNNIIYLSQDGEKIISGDIYNLKDQYSYTDRIKNDLRKKAIANVKDADKIVYRAKKEKYKISIFTDISCPYCTKIHQHINDFNDKGITVEYLAFPRAGIGSKHQKIMQDIWCSDDKALSLTVAKMEQQFPKKSCTGTQTIDQFHLGEEIGVQATPTIVFSDGELQAGYIQPNDLLDILEEKFPQ